MSDSGKVYSASERVRRAYLNVLADQKKRLDPQADSGMDELVIDRSMLADESSGLVFRKYTIEKSTGPADPDEPFVLHVPLWDRRSERDTLRIEHSDKGVVWTVVSDEYGDYRDANTPDPYPVEILKSQDPLRVEGVHYFRSWVMDNDENSSISPSVVLLFDRDSPYSKNPPPKFPDIPAVTDESLADNKDTAKLELPAYTSWAEGDQVLVYWMNRLPDNIADLDPPIVTLPTTGAAQVVSIPGDKIRAVGDGGVYVVYVLVDKPRSPASWRMLANCRLAISHAGRWSTMPRLAIWCSMAGLCSLASPMLTIG